MQLDLTEEERHELILGRSCDINSIQITDERDIQEIERRKKLKWANPLRSELYSVNPNFDGTYSDEHKNPSLKK